MPEGGPSVGVEQITIDLFGRKNLGRGSLSNEIDALANPRKHRREWRPWMADDDAAFLAENPGPAPAVPKRPAPYPATAQPGKFLLDR
jgi:hypothetical protein